MAGNKYITPDVFVLSRTEDTNSNTYSATQGAFKACWEHLKYLETLGITTEIARNHGNAVSGRGPGTGWWDESTRFGNNGWSVFKWNSNSNRTWEWYMFIQNCDTTGPAAPGTPGRTATGAGNTRGFCVATAISISGSATNNPWGGTTGSLGSDTKGDPVWVTGSVGSRLFIFPGSNGISGSHSTQRHNMAGDFEVGLNNESTRIHFISDNDTFIWIRQRNDSSLNFGIIYLGLYEPFSRFDANGIEDEDFPNFVAYAKWSGFSAIPPWAAIENTGGSAGTETVQGACILSYESHSQMRPIRTLTIGDVNDLVNLRTYAGLQMPLFDANFAVSTAERQKWRGIVGSFDPDMLQITVDVPPFVRITNTAIPKTVWLTNIEDSNLTTCFVTPWPAEAPILEKQDRFGERRRFVITSSV